ncbi:MAG: LamG-like jellyroll fold domain-containing protein, partial [Thermoguttaceae bacterium]
MIDERPSEELARLLSALVDDQLDDVGRQRLVGLLRSDPAARRQYLRHMLTDAALWIEHTATPVGRGLESDIGVSASDRDDLDLAIPSERPGPNAEESSLPPIIIDTSPLTPSRPLSTLFAPGGWAFSYGVSAVVVAAVLLICWARQISHHQELARSPLPDAARAAAPETPSIGRVSGMANCRWAKGGARPATDMESIPQGRKYVLDSGLLEITYRTGAKVVLQGPCIYEADSDCGGFLSSGKLIARVEKSEIRNPKSEQRSPLSPLPAPHFAVRTPTAVITDLGTEFGVEVTDRGDAVAHVLEGKIEVRPLGPSLAAKEAVHDGLPPPIKLTAGRSVRIVKGEGPEPRIIHGDADAAAFPVRPGHLGEFVKQERLEAFRQWQVYSQRLRKDAGLIAYYTFETRGRDPTRDMSILPNMAATGPALDGQINGPRWAEGRFPGKFALRFDGPGHRDRVEIPVSQRLSVTGPFTLAVWFQPGAAGYNCGHLLSKGDQEWQFFTSSKDNAWCVRFATGGMTNRPKVYNELSTWATFDPDRWWLAVAVFEPKKEAATKRLYLDGRLKGQSTIALPTTTPTDNATVLLGDNAGWGAGGEYIGLIDEVA